MCAFREENGGGAGGPGFGSRNPGRPGTGGRRVSVPKRAVTNGEGSWYQVMDETSDTRQRLSNRIDEKQQAIRAYLGKERPRRTRLASISIVGSALAASLTAGPAVGGTGFTEAVANIFNLPDDSIVWRVLCLLAVICSIAAALATNFATSHSLADRVSAAETSSAQLEGLQVALNFGHIEIDEAVKLYQQYSTQVPFVEGFAGH